MPTYKISLKAEVKAEVKKWQRQLQVRPDLKFKEH